MYSFFTCFCEENMVFWRLLSTSCYIIYTHAVVARIIKSGMILPFFPSFPPLSYD